MTNQQLTLSWAAKSGDYPLPEAYNGAGVANEPNCEDRLEIRLRVNAFGVIESAGFSLTESACPPMWACAVYACAQCQGRPALAALTMDHKKIGCALTEDGEPDIGHIHCAMMAEIALKRALADYGERFRR